MLHLEDPGLSSKRRHPPATLEMCNGVLHFTLFVNKREKLQPALPIIGTSYKAIYIGAGVLMSDTGIERHLGVGDTSATFHMAEARTIWT